MNFEGMNIKEELRYKYPATIVHAQELVRVHTPRSGGRGYVSAVRIVPPPARTRWVLAIVAALAVLGASGAVVVSLVSAVASAPGALILACAGVALLAAWRCRRGRSTTVAVSVRVRR